MIRWLAFIVWSLSCTAATAGAWAREDGEFFISASSYSGLSDRGSGGFSLYSEYGLTPRITLGIDGYMSSTDQTAHGFVFARYALGQNTSPNRFAISLGLGHRRLWDDVDALPVARIGAHWGRGLRSGWLAADSYITLTEDMLAPTATLDATWGLRRGDRWIWLLETNARYVPQGDSYVEFSPSLVWRLNDRISLQVGLRHTVVGNENNGLRIGTWLEF